MTQADPGDGHSEIPATGLVDAKTFDELTDAIVALDPQPRERRSVILSLCIAGATWSIGAHYNSVVVPLVRNLAREFGVEQPTALMSERFVAVNAALRKIPGGGTHAVRRDYLWMLIGQDDLIKPDRMMLRWFKNNDILVDPVGARDLIAALVSVVSTRLKRMVTAWEIDHALWAAGRGL